MIGDREKKNGLFWLKGSKKFQLMKGVSESLAGRVAICALLRFSQAEFSQQILSTLIMITYKNRHGKKSFFKTLPFS
jgi:hypothetical protein